MVHPSLWLLMKYSAAGRLRRLLRGAHTFRGMLLILLVAAIMGLAVFGTFVSRQVTSKDAITPQAVAGMLLAMGLYQLLIYRGEAIRFTNAEAQFLFTAPFSRRMLLAYRLVTQALTALLTGVLFMFVLLPRVPAPACGYVGVSLSLLLAQHLSIVMVQIRQKVSGHLFSRGRRIGMGLVLAAALYVALGSSVPDSPREVLQRIESLGVLAPFMPFGRVIAGSGLGEVAGQIGLALAVDAVLVALIFGLDVNNLEAAMARAEREHQRRQRAARSGMPPVEMSLGKVRWSIGMLPWWDGAGPIAWQQITHGWRTSKGLLAMLLLVAFMPMAVSLGKFRVVYGEVVVGGAAYVLFIMAMVLPIGFRSQHAHFVWLKQLPVSARSAVLGHVLPGTVMLSLLTWIAMGSMAPMLTDRQGVFWAAMPTMPILILFLLSLEAAVFLWIPMPQGNQAGDTQAIGRAMVLVFLRMLVVLLGVAIIGGAVGLIHWLGGPPVLMFLIGVGMLATYAFATLELAVALYKSFQVDHPLLHYEE